MSTMTSNMPQFLGDSQNRHGAIPQLNAMASYQNAAQFGFSTYQHQQSYAPVTTMDALASTSMFPTSGSLSYLTNDNGAYFNEPSLDPAQFPSPKRMRSELYVGSTQQSSLFPPELSDSGLHSQSSSAMQSPHLGAQVSSGSPYNAPSNASPLMVPSNPLIGAYGDQNSFTPPATTNLSMDYVSVSSNNQWGSTFGQSLDSFDPALFPTGLSPMAFNNSQFPSRPHSRLSAGRRSPTPNHGSGNYLPYPSRPSSSSPSNPSTSHSSSKRSSSHFDADLDLAKEDGRCPIPGCRKVYKDLRAHMITHQEQRPEKCPIPSCEYYVKGFARKYDKNRHTLTHYKGTMICDFCSGAGSVSEKTFNRADVFKRHLISMHGVEQAPPNSRKKNTPKSKDVTPAEPGTCSTCKTTFISAQALYEHLDECVFRVVQQIDPAEAINQQHLTTISEVKEVKDTLTKHHLSNSIDLGATTLEDDEDEDDSDEEDVDPKLSASGDKPHPGAGRSTKQSRAGLTRSKGGVRHAGAAALATMSSRKKRKNYPASWGCSADKMKMKKRVLCVYDGERRLIKDDMMLDEQFQVRVPYLAGNEDAYVTDLDFQTLRRADGIWNSTEEERGPWVPDNLIEYNALDQSPGSDAFLMT